MIEQHHLYLEDTYRFTVTTAVVDAGDAGDGPWLALAENVFHPQGGGQPADAGTVDGVPVRPYKATGTGAPPGARAAHVVRLGHPGDRNFAPGELVTAAVDRTARLRHAALHTCGHVVDGFVRQAGYRHRVSNHFPGQARIEFDAGDGPRPDLARLAAEVEERTRQAIDAGLRVGAEQRDGRRLVTVAGLPADPCGGTHVTSLDRLTGFALRSVKVKGGVLKVGYRVEHKAGHMAGQKED
ncbi:alanyl-tRNA synthetase [Streptomyces sp. B8F3]|uniref:alanyl-tRNA synthetase n=1 Tax=Streptomyces sp. B8F3 TaxID=3153573 RepID=UPI00325E6A9B